MATPSAIPVNATRDSVQRLHRVTREKRSLWYQLAVLQQPERARACGAGSKAHSDRRPVDPPPVVELRIFEGDSVETGKDITFDYNANFFCYASLEQARPMAHGRVQTPATQSPPILTGVPASGMAYLDKPTSAGYFIFPDLSVRHEGRYVLSFSLFETTKEEKDFDLDPAQPDLPPGVDWRMEIKTVAFNVYSAKKFPGLMQSTDLSKTVADQGCRVRIRREVRMRKRKDKHNNGFERHEQEISRHRTVTPAREDSRARSLSNSSEQRTPYGPEHQRHPSGAESFPPPPPPAYESTAAPARGHLSFGDPKAAQYATPHQPASYNNPQMAPISPGGPYTPSGPSHYAKAEPTTYSTYQPIRPMSQSSQGSGVHMNHDSRERRPSATQVPQSPTAYGSMDSRSRTNSGASYPPTPMSGHTLIAPQPPYSATKPMTIHSIIDQNPIIEPETEQPLPPLPISTGGKRKHDIVFRQQTTALHNRQRQEDPHYAHGRRTLLQDPTEAPYARADGRLHRVIFNTFH